MLVYKPIDFNNQLNIVKKCGFYDCFFTLTGEKYEDTKLKRINRQNWTEVGNEIFYFESDPDGNSEWNS